MGEVIQEGDQYHDGADEIKWVYSTYRMPLRRGDCTYRRKLPVSTTVTKHDNEKPPSLSTQVGGNHYKTLPIQPVEFILANDLGFCEGAIIKYVTRHASKGGRADLEKAAHFIQILIEHKYPETTPA